MATVRITANELKAVHTKWQREQETDPGEIDKKQKEAEAINNTLDTISIILRESVACSDSGPRVHFVVPNAKVISTLGLNSIESTLCGMGYTAIIASYQIDAIPNIGYWDARVLGGQQFEVRARLDAKYPFITIVNTWGN
jgi:hypothetical protein